MKRKKLMRWPVMLCALVLAWLCAGTALAVDNPFDDVYESDAYYDAVMWAYTHNVTGGTTAKTFSPASTCNRGQVVTFLWRASGQPEPKTKTNPFTDVKQGKYYYKAVLWAVENGITNGTSDTKFSPGNPCTYAHVITFLWRANGQPKPDSVFGDAWYSHAASWGHENGLLTGAVFRPAEPCPRAHIILYLYRNQTGNTVSDAALIREILQANILGDTLESAAANEWDEEWLFLYFQGCSDPGDHYIPSLDEEYVLGVSLGSAILNDCGGEWLALYYNGSSQSMEEPGSQTDDDMGLTGDWLDEGDPDTGKHFSTMHVAYKDGVYFFEVDYRGGYTFTFSGVWEDSIIHYENCVCVHRDEIEYTNGEGTVMVDVGILIWHESDGDMILYHKP